MSPHNFTLLDARNSARVASCPDFQSSRVLCVWKPAPSREKRSMRCLRTLRATLRTFTGSCPVTTLPGINSRCSRPSGSSKLPGMLPNKLPIGPVSDVKTEPKQLQLKAVADFRAFGLASGLTVRNLRKMAARVGIEPTTKSLTATCSATELPGIYQNKLCHVSAGRGKQEREENVRFLHVPAAPVCYQAEPRCNFPTETLLIRHIRGCLSGEI